MKNGTIHNECQTYLRQDLIEPVEDLLIVQLVPIVWKTIHEFPQRLLRFERQQGQTESDISPLANGIRQVESLTQLLDNTLRLLVL